MHSFTVHSRRHCLSVRACVSADGRSRGKKTQVRPEVQPVSIVRLESGRGEAEKEKREKIKVTAWLSFSSWRQGYILVFSFSADSNTIFSLFRLVPKRQPASDRPILLCSVPVPVPGSVPGWLCSLFLFASCSWLSLVITGSTSTSFGRFDG